MVSLRASELRDDLATAVNRVAFGGERIVIRRNNKDVAALVSMEDYELLRELEDRIDLDAIRKATGGKGSNVSWDKLKKDLGL